MQITIRAHHLELSPAMEEKIQTQFTKITKHVDSICSVQVKLAKDHRIPLRSHKGESNHTAEVILRLPGKEIFAQAIADDMYQAIHLLSEKLRRQLERYKAHKLAA